MLILRKAANDQSEKPKQPDDRSLVMPFMEFLAVPSIADFKQLVRDGGSLTLKEIKSVTIEKLTNKIIRSFVNDLVWYVPLLMLVLL
jgi:hypothetical protein